MSAGALGDPATLAAVVLIMGLAAFAKGVTGLGFSTAALSFLALVVDVRLAIPLVILPSLASNALVMARAGHLAEMAWRFRWLYAGAALGVGCGLVLLASTRDAVAGLVLGLVLLVYIAFAWRRPDLRLPARLEAPLAPAVGLATGLINGWTGSQVMPVLPYLAALGLDPNRFVQAINLSFTLSSLIMAAGLARLGLLDGTILAAGALCILPVFVGVRLGTRLRDRLDPETFRRGVLVMLAASAVLLVARGF
ncbi:MAG: sulfite exporter TauE/SafE family protein [Pseudomonadota bacterium]